jgi:hypothetical protein
MPVRRSHRDRAPSHAAAAMVLSAYLPVRTASYGTLISGVAGARARTATPKGISALSRVRALAPRQCGWRL